MQKSSPKELGEDDNIFDSADWYIKNRLNGVYAFIAVKDGQIIFENYYNGHNMHSLSHVASITKSITSSLIGIAISDDCIQNVNQPISNFFHDNTYLHSSFIRKITIRDLLTMTSGVQYTANYFGNKQNWIDSILGLPFDMKSYKRFQYEDGNAHLISAILKNTTGMNIREYANKNLFSKLGIEEITANEIIETNKYKNTSRCWWTDPQGLNTGGWGLSLTARDMAKLGCLYCNNGIWNMNKVISSEWINESTSMQIKVNSGHGLEKGYGYYWWIGEENGYKFYFARGRGEQYIIVVPKLNMVFVFKGSEDSSRTSNIALFWKVHLFSKLIDKYS